MKDLIQYDFNGRNIRTIIGENGEPWWVVKDVCEVFGDSHYLRSVSRLDEDEKGMTRIDTPGGLQNMMIVDESGLYSLLFLMQPQQGNISGKMRDQRIDYLKRFKRWITHEVLPSIRKTGTYSIQDKKLLLATALIEANKIIEDQAPKVEAYETFIEARGLYTISAVAKTLDTGQKRLFNLLREKGILMTNNQPYQRYIDSGYFETKWRTLPTGFNYSQTFVTPKGIDYIATIQKILR